MNLLKPDPIYRNGYKDPQRISDIHLLPCSLCLYLKQEQTSPTTAHHKIGMGLGKKASDILSPSATLTTPPPDIDPKSPPPPNFLLILDPVTAVAFLYS